MENYRIYVAGVTEACRYAYTYLRDRGLPVSLAPGGNVRHLLLDVPSFGPEGQLRMGGAPEDILRELPEDVTVYGGNLNHPGLGALRTVDFLQDAEYLAQNAYITAECALDVAIPYLPVTLRGCPVLILGWGRIGKCLAQLLNAIGADVTVAARQESHRAILKALGYRAEDPTGLSGQCDRYRLVFNTVPAPVLTETQLAHFRQDCVMIDLASRPGIRHPDVILARGLPGIHMPESSGQLIAQTFLRYWKEERT